LVQSSGPLLSHDWLVGCGVAVAAPLANGILTCRPQRKISLALTIPVVAIVLALIATDLYAVRGLESSSLAAYKINYPVARFAHRYYYRNGITADDIGMISFLTDGRYLDLSGVASSKITRGKVDHFLSAGLIGRLSKDQGSRVAIISDHYGKALPDNWVKLASWEMQNIETWSFYAIDTSAATSLKSYLADYHTLLPPHTRVQYFYSPHP